MEVDDHDEGRFEASRLLKTKEYCSALRFAKRTLFFFCLFPGSVKMFCVRDRTDTSEQQKAGLVWEAFVSLW